MAADKRSDDLGRDPASSPDIKALEAQLAALAPRSDRLNRERLMFLAGRASVNDPPAIGTASRRGWLWPASTGALVGAAAALVVVAASPGVDPPAPPAPVAVASSAPRPSAAPQPSSDRVLSSLAWRPVWRAASTHCLTAGARISGLQSLTALEAEPPYNASVGAAAIDAAPILSPRSFDAALPTFELREATS
jgi:hypothetical protein